MAKYIGFGTLIYGSTVTTSGTTPTAVLALVENIDGPDASRGEIDVTTLDSTAKEYRVGPREPGSVSMTFVWDPVTPSTGAQWVKNRYDDGKESRFSIEWPGSSDTKIKFNAYVTGFNPSFPLEDKITAAVSLKLSGAIEWPT